MLVEGDLMKLIEAKVTNLVFDPSNVRTHSQKNLDAIKGSLTKFGQQKPIVIDDKGVVVAGNGTLAAAKELGWESIQAVQTELDSLNKTAFAIADNRTGELADWDTEALDAQLASLKLNDFDIGDIGFDDIDLDLPSEPNEKDDEIPEVEENEFGVKLGDVWQLGNHRLMCGDSTDKDQVDLLMDGEKADMVYTDPPYGISEEGDRSKRGGLCQGNKLKSFKDDSIEYAVKAYDLCESIGIKRQVWWGANYYCHSIPQSNNWFVWDKRVEEQNKDHQSDCELAWVKSKWSSVRIFRHVWKGMIKDSEHGSKRVHPTQKPIALAEWSMDYFKDVKSVLDLFLGSGSTLIACEKTNRKCFGMEIDPHYCSVIIKRWQDYTGQQASKI
jgi:DNA modification methylase